MYQQNASIEPLLSGIDDQHVEDKPYRGYVEECLGMLMDHGTARYGGRDLPLLVTILDVRDRECPEVPPRTTCGPAARPAYFPTPYRNCQYGEADLSWGRHQEYRWETARAFQTPPVAGWVGVPVSLRGIRALCVEASLKSGCGAGLCELRVNAGSVRPDRKAGTYFVEGAGSPNSTYADQVFVNSRECLQNHFIHSLEALDDGLPPESAGSPPEIDSRPTRTRDGEAASTPTETDVPAFVWQERPIGYSTENQMWRPRRGTVEWVMYEFDDPVDIESVELFWVDDGETIQPPDSWKLLYAIEVDASKVNYPIVTTVPWRGENRDSFWRPRASDFFEDQPTYRAMYLLSEICGGRRFADFADRSQSAAMELRGDKGMFWWGSHRYYDVFTHEKMSPNGDYHEILTKRPGWDRLWKINPEATREELEGIWTWHIVDKATGEHNRHNNGRRDHSFSASGGQFIYALASLYRQTGRETYLQGAEKIAEFHWNHRNPKTGLTPCDPDEKVRFDGFHCGHQVLGYHCYYLIKSYELTGREVFLRNALTYLKAYARYGYDDAAGRFYGTVHVETGKPPTGSRVYSDYRSQMPSGHTDLWQPYQYGYEHPLQVAQCYAYAYAVSGDREMLDTARKWADFIRTTPPKGGCRTDTWYELYARLFSQYGAFAEHYGRTVSFFNNMYVNTGEALYLEDARRTAREAVSALYYDGLFRGHPARPYYSAIDGVGYLLVALLQLDRILESDLSEPVTPMSYAKAGLPELDNW